VNMFGPGRNGITADGLSWEFICGGGGIVQHPHTCHGDWTWLRKKAHDYTIEWGLGFAVILPSHNCSERECQHVQSEQVKRYDETDAGLEKCSRRTRHCQGWSDAKEKRRYALQATLLIPSRMETNNWI
jgi:hypothetical protein